MLVDRLVVQVVSLGDLVRLQPVVACCDGECALIDQIPNFATVAEVVATLVGVRSGGVIAAANEARCSKSDGTNGAA